MIDYVARGTWLAVGVAAAALAALAASPKQSYVPILKLDFGGSYQQRAPGYTPIGRVFTSARYLWVSPVQDTERPNFPDPLLKDFASGKGGEFWMGLDDGEYRLTLILSDPEKAAGPFSVFLQDQPVRVGIRLAPREVQRLTFPVQVTRRKLRLRFQAEAGHEFIVNGLILEGPPGAKTHSLFAEAPPDTLPSRAEVLRQGNADVRGAVRKYCDWLVSRRLPNGFLGDAMTMPAHIAHYWYTISFPVRALLAGHELLGEPRYRDVVFDLLDRLVDEQLPNGAWTQGYMNKPAAKLSREELEDIYQHRWMNMADIGSAAAALGVGAHYASGPRRDRYVAALRKYCEQWASRWQLPSGGFTNGMENGKPQTAAYSVATASEASAFAALYAMTGEQRHMDVAERAASFLLDQWQPDGRPLCYQHWSTNGGKIYPQPLTETTDIYYYNEGLLFVYCQSKNPQFRAKMERVLRTHMNGSFGLRRYLGEAAWFPLADTWNNSKSAGLPIPFVTFQQMAPGAGLGQDIETLKRFLATPEYARRIGVMVDDPDMPWARHSLQSWSGCAIAATGMAAMSLEEMLQPGVIFMRAPAKPAKTRAGL